MPLLSAPPGSLPIFGRDSGCYSRNVASPDPAPVPFRYRGMTVGVMGTAALVATALLRKTPIDDVVVAMLGVLLFPTGLGYAFRGDAHSDALSLLMLIGPYLAYSGLGLALAFVRSRDGFVVGCVVLAVLLSINVKGCTSAESIRWMSS